MKVAAAQSKLRARLRYWLRPCGSPYFRKTSSQRSALRLPWTPQEGDDEY